MDGSDWILSGFHTSAAANKLKRERKKIEKKEGLKFKEIQ